MFLHVVGHNQRFSCIKMTFRRSTETISRNFQEVLYAIGELKNELIVEPSSGVPPKILHSRRWYPFFKVCQNRNSNHVKLLDVHKCLLSHTYVGLCRSNWWNTCFGHCSWEAQGCFSWEEAHHYPECLTAVDFDLRFTYVLAGWEGSAHDARILTDALQRPDGLKVPQGITIVHWTVLCTTIEKNSWNLIHLISPLVGKFYLVDAGYACRPWFLPPYRGTRYHLREYGTRRPQNSRELFNLSIQPLELRLRGLLGHWRIGSRYSTTSLSIPTIPKWR